MTLTVRSGWLMDKFLLEALGEDALGMFGAHNCSVDIPDRALEGSEEFHLRVALNGRERVGFSMA